MTGQIFARRRQLKIFLVERDFSDEQFEKARPFKPPVPEQLRVERNDDDWIDIECRDLAQLPAALLKKMSRVRIGRLFRLLTIVKLFVHVAAGGAVIFHAGEFSRSTRDRAEMFA